MTTSRPSIEEVWTRIRDLAGQQFATKTGKAFSYEISGDIFHPSRTEYNISKAEFRKALQLVPFDGPGVINNTVRGPAYVWAVLHDSRVRKHDW